jgi:hypothetical protein
MDEKRNGCDFEISRKGEIEVLRMQKIFSEILESDILPVGTYIYAL